MAYPKPYLDVCLRFSVCVCLQKLEQDLQKAAQHKTTRQAAARQLRQPNLSQTAGCLQMWGSGNLTTQGVHLTAQCQTSLAEQPIPLMDVNPKFLGPSMWAAFKSDHLELYGRSRSAVAKDVKWCADTVVAVAVHALGWCGKVATAVVGLLRRWSPIVGEVAVRLCRWMAAKLSVQNEQQPLRVRVDEASQAECQQQYLFQVSASSSEVYHTRNAPQMLTCYA